MQQFSDAFSQLNIHHTIWVTKAGFLEKQLAEEKYSKNWVASEWEKVDNLQDQVNELHMQHLPDSIKIRLSQIETLKSGIFTKLTQLLTKTSSDAVPTISSSCAIAYKEILSDVQSSLRNEFLELSGNLLLLYKANTARHCEDFEYFLREQDIITTI